MTQASHIYAKRLDKLRVLMAKHQIDCVIVPSADPHMSEYLPEHWQARAWLSGFIGSMGVLMVGMDFAHLWADSRYWVQAQQQLVGTGIELQKLRAGVSMFGELTDRLHQGACVAVDGAVLSVADFQQLKAVFADKVTLRVDVDLVGEIWQDRAQLPDAPIYVHLPQFAGVSAMDKLAHIRQAMQQQGAKWHLVSSLDDIAWLTNLRGSDVAFNPVFLAHLLIGQDSATLFVSADKLTDEAREQLTAAGIGVADYHTVREALAKINGKTLIDPARVAIGVADALPKGAAQMILATNPSVFAKSIKTPEQLNHIREAMCQDGAALCEFFAQFEDNLAAGVLMNECDIDTMLIKARARQPHFVSPSFDTIAGFNANGAIVHYRARQGDCADLVGDGLLLIDSGAQYHNGTTDITRMAGIGKVSEAQKYDVTMVLKAHIALARTIFPARIKAGLLDSIARAPLWQAGMDFGHGTGHGVGYFLNVHEGPQSFSPLAVGDERTLQLGMVTTDEPGLYRTDLWGVRLENCLLTVPAMRNEFGEFWQFETLTLCPFDTRLLLLELLCEAEKSWLNAYHQTVQAKLIDRVSGAAKAWLVARTQPIE